MPVGPCPSLSVRVGPCRDAAARAAGHGDTRRDVHG